MGTWKDDPFEVVLVEEEAGDAFAATAPSVQSGASTVDACPTLPGRGHGRGSTGSISRSGRC